MAFSPQVQNPKHFPKSQLNQKQTINAFLFLRQIFKNLKTSPVSASATLTKIVLYCGSSMQLRAGQVSSPEPWDTFLFSGTDCWAAPSAPLMRELHSPRSCFFITAAPGSLPLSSKNTAQGAAIPPGLAFLLKRAALWHHASRKPMGCIHLSEYCTDIREHKGPPSGTKEEGGLGHCSKFCQAGEGLLGSKASLRQRSQDHHTFASVH